MDVGFLRGHRLLVAALCLMTLLGACGESEGGSDSHQSDRQRPRVVTTLAPITSIVANVAGDLAEIEGLVPEGSDSHTFEPPPSRAKVLSQADIIFINGLMLEDPIKELAQGRLKKGAEIIELGRETIRPEDYIYDFSFPKEEGKPNPHLWTNPPMAKEYARVAAGALGRRDPGHADTYEANYERFAAKVDELDSAMSQASRTVPKRELLTYHDAYAYFAKHYDWKVIGAVQVSNFEDPTPKEVGDLIDQVKARGVPAIFGSEVFPSPVLAQIGKDAGVRYVDVLRDDDLPGGPGQAEHSWLGLMRFNFITMVQSLGGDASALKAVKVENAAPDKATYPQ
ncbi:MAG: metal ABC transporter substrate-binding protein [Actinomycetota bacterium]|nr:metal ABC transporter substrate-binding protein [Actinomycetota bacterium]MDQ3575943.1 metal ABC transporter substrate-binding protein [Actinomycetota bacterium]